jgi:alpha-D-ribose 1-methylphosphonate 5-triphosphate synthase subunit PhnH
MGVDAGIRAGFADPVLHGQSTFRVLLEVLSRPGTIGQLPHPPDAPPGLGPACAAIALALIDFETPVWLDSALGADEQLVSWLKFHTGAPVTGDPATAAFALIGTPESMPPRTIFAMGSAEYPDTSTTLILAVEAMGNDSGVTFSGPGIAGKKRFGAAPLPADFWAETEAVHAAFPRGNDVFFGAGESVAALSRSTRISRQKGY